MPPLPDHMRYPESGFWWLHALSFMAVFCWGWFHGQNRAQRRFARLVEAMKDPEAPRTAQEGR